MVMMCMMSILSMRTMGSMMRIYMTSLMMQFMIMSMIMMSMIMMSTISMMFMMKLMISVNMMIRSIIEIMVMHLMSCWLVFLSFWIMGLMSVFLIKL